MAVLSVHHSIWWWMQVCRRLLCRYLQGSLPNSSWFAQWFDSTVSRSLFGWHRLALVFKGNNFRFKFTVVLQQWVVGPASSDVHLSLRRWHLYLSTYDHSSLGSINIITQKLYRSWYLMHCCPLQFHTTESELFPCTRQSPAFTHMPPTQTNTSN